MVGLLTTLFVILSVVLAGLVLLQQGKGDLGMGGLGNSGQMLFGGSGGQEFFERLTWILGALFILGALGLTILKSTSTASRLKNYQAPVKLGGKKEAASHHEASHAPTAD